ncbi:MAG: hypothetical protein AAF799_38865 [Myxococcota bacterium]
MTEALVLLFCLAAMLATPVWLVARFSRGPLGLEGESGPPRRSLPRPAPSPSPSTAPAPRNAP